jgi:hypothetical protein
MIKKNMLKVIVTTDITVENHSLNRLRNSAKITKGKVVTIDGVDYTSAEAVNKFGAEHSKLAQSIWSVPFTVQEVSVSLNQKNSFYENNEGKRISVAYIVTDEWATTLKSVKSAVKEAYLSLN